MIIRTRRLSRLLLSVLILVTLFSGTLLPEKTTLAAETTASVWAYGSNSASQLGFERSNVVPKRPTPVQVLGSGANQALALGAGRKHSVLVRPDGIVHTWGDNSRGQLGIGSTLANYNIPREIPSFGTVSVIAVGALHTLALTNGQVYGWGDNTRGQLGAGTFDSCGGTGCNRSPVNIALPPGGTVVGIGAGDHHSFAVMADGTLWSWGYNNLGQLGSGMASDTSSIPVQVVGDGGVGVLTDVVAATGGEAHSVALHRDGTVSVWGWNYYCQHGIGTCDLKNNIIHPYPTKVPGLNNVAAIASGQRHSLALKRDGTVWAWGYNADGEVGDGTNSPRVFPVSPTNDPYNSPYKSNEMKVRQVVGLTNVVAIEAGDWHSMALKGDGSVWHWGKNEAYQQGNTSGGSRVEPVEVAEFGRTTTIAAGGSHSLMLRTLEILSFPDVSPNHPYFDAIGQLSSRNIIRGYQDGSFGPEDSTLRAQMAALICRAMGWDVEDHNNVFPDQGDVDADLWRNVGTLAYYKVALGYPDKLFHPTDNVLYAQVISFITRAMVAKGAWTQRSDIAAMYPNIPANSGHRQDIVTYVFYAGPLPGTSAVTDPWSAWDQPSTRAWFAQALWQALSR